MRLFSDNKLFRGGGKTKHVCANLDVNSKLEIILLKLSDKKKTHSKMFQCCCLLVNLSPGLDELKQILFIIVIEPIFQALNNFPKTCIGCWPFTGGQKGPHFDCWSKL